MLVEQRIAVAVDVMAAETADVLVDDRPHRDWSKWDWLRSKFNLSHKIATTVIGPIGDILI